MENLYHEELLELYRHPLNKKAIADATLRHREHNPLCGDTIELYLKMDGERLTDIGFQGNGCVISDVGASLLTETVKGKTTTEIRALTAAAVLELLNIKQLNPTRTRCATLAWEALKKTFDSLSMDKNGAIQ